MLSSSKVSRMDHRHSESPGIRATPQRRLITFNRAQWMLESLTVPLLNKSQLMRESHSLRAIISSGITSCLSDHLRTRPVSLTAPTSSLCFRISMIQHKQLIPRLPCDSLHDTINLPPTSRTLTSGSVLDR